MTIFSSTMKVLSADSYFYLHERWNWYESRWSKHTWTLENSDLVWISWLTFLYTTSAASTYRQEIQTKTVTEELMRLTLHSSIRTDTLKLIAKSPLPTTQCYYQRVNSSLTIFCDQPLMPCLVLQEDMCSRYPRLLFLSSKADTHKLSH